MSLWYLCPLAFSAIPPSQPLTNSHPAVALKTGALVLVALDPSRLLRGTVFRMGPQAGIALGATERRWVRRLEKTADEV